MAGNVRFDPNVTIINPGTGDAGKTGKPLVPPKPKHLQTNPDLTSRTPLLNQDNMQKPRFTAQIPSNLVPTSAATSGNKLVDIAQHGVEKSTVSQQAVMAGINQQAELQGEMQLHAAELKSMQQMIEALSKFIKGVGEGVNRVA